MGFGSKSRAIPGGIAGPGAAGDRCAGAPGPLAGPALAPPGLGVPPGLCVLVASRAGFVEGVVVALEGAGVGGAGAPNRKTNGAASVGMAVNPPLHAEEPFFVVLAGEGSTSFSQSTRARSAPILARWPEPPATNASSLKPREPIRFPTM